MSKKKARRKSPQKREMPERIPDSPENIMRALVEAPPKKVRDWEYLKELPPPPRLLQEQHQVREE